MRLSLCLLILALLAALAGCASLHSHSRVLGAELKPSELPLSGGPAYVAMPGDWIDEATVYRGSGLATAEAVARAFAPHLASIVVADMVEDKAAALASARKAGAAYLLYPEILRWEDRKTEWTGKADRVSVRLSLLDTARGEILDAAVVSGMSPLLTTGGDHPQDLLEKPLRDYADMLFAPRRD